MADRQTQSLIDPTAYLLYQALSKLGWDTQDAGALADRVRRLAIGLPAEDELSVILTWLGKCRLIHKLDQAQAPASTQGQYRVPDLMAVFDHRGHEVPVLIEVKRSQTLALSWRPDYITSLRRYGQVLGLPMLVAWKIVPMGAWFLVDLERFQLARTNHRLTLEMAMRDNLLGALAGDFAVMFQPGFGLSLDLMRVETLSREVREGAVTEQLVMQVTDARFLSPTNERITRLGAGLWTLFLAAQHEEEMIETDDGYRLSFVIPPGQFGTWAHVAITSLLMLQGGADSPNAPFPWRTVLQEQRFPLSHSALAEAAANGIDQGIVHYVMHQVPNVMPTFLEDRG